MSILLKVPPVSRVGVKSPSFDISSPSPTYPSCSIQLGRQVSDLSDRLAFRRVLPPSRAVEQSCRLGCQGLYSSAQGTLQAAVCICFAYSLKDVNTDRVLHQRASGGPREFIDYFICPFTLGETGQFQD